MSAFPRSIGKRSGEVLGLNKICSVSRGLTIEEGSLEDYKRLAEFHCRNPETHPIPLKIFVLRREDSEPVGVIYYSWPPPNCSGRRKAFGRNLSLEEINKKLATISRVVLHPKYRSMGLGVRLVKETLPLAGRPYVETMAVMARYNPFFEKAGMKKIMVRRPGRSIVRAVEKLRKLGFRSYLMAGSRTNLNHLKTLSVEDLEKTKEILCSVGYHKRLQSSSKPYVKRSEFREWISRKSLRTVAKVVSRLAVLAETKAYLLWEQRSIDLKDGSVSKSMEMHTENT